MWKKTGYEYQLANSNEDSFDSLELDTSQDSSFDLSFDHDQEKLSSTSSAFPSDRPATAHVIDPPRYFSRRLKLILLLLVFSLSLISLAPRYSIHLTPPHLPSSFLQSPHAQNAQKLKNPLLKTRVGKRKHSGFYHGKGCNSTELMDSLRLATIRDDGPSRFEGTSPTSNKLNLDNFEFSFDLPSCPQPHIFTPHETCDLLSSFGGIFLRGDSLVRHLSHTLLMLLTDSLDIVRSDDDECTGEDLFTNGRKCRLASFFDSDESGDVCDEKAFVKYEQVWRFIVAPYKLMKRNKLKYPAEEYPSPDNPVGNLTNFLNTIPQRRRQYSPVVLLSSGIHFDFRTEDAVDYHLAPYFRNTSSMEPRPISLWSAYSAIGPRKPKKFLVKQGTEAILRFNDDIRRDVLPKLSPGQVSEGAMRSLEWYGITDGAFSYDGTHHSFQVNMEKVQIILNLLDTIWGEIVEQGGLVE
ncbi:hypothetical protein T439DRAFT_379278 [Meredithblackwellia eburnea MCA 4105]